MCFLGFLGCFLRRLEILYWIGVILLWATSAKRFDKQPLCACFGQCGRQRIILLLMMRFFQSEN